jgi:hypothetical protein
MDICVRIGWLALPFFSVDVLSGVLSIHILSRGLPHGANLQTGFVNRPSFGLILRLSSLRRWDELPQPTQRIIPASRHRPMHPENVRRPR